MKSSFFGEFWPDGLVLHCQVKRDARVTMHFPPYLLKLPSRLFQELSVFTSNYNSSSKFLEFIQFLFSNPDLTLISSLTVYCSARILYGEV